MNSERRQQQTPKGGKVNGYFREKSNSKNQEVEPLDFNQVEFVSDDEDDVDALDDRLRYEHGYKHECPRCGSIQTVASRFPYCAYCNWDSLVDSLGANDEWAA
jgi:hypothetical protein